MSIPVVCISVCLRVCVKPGLIYNLNNSWFKLMRLFYAVQFKSIRHKYVLHGVVTQINMIKDMM